MTTPAAEIQVTAYGQTDVGLKRDHNEDALVMVDLTTNESNTLDWLDGRPVGDRGILLGVSDGMGGHEAGEVASALVVESLKAHLGDDGRLSEIQTAMKQSVELANQDVWNAAQESGRNMGATLTAVLIHKSFAYIASVGDSRAYLIRKGRIRQVTKDQSYVEVLVSAGIMTREQAQQSQYRNVIMQAMGHRPNVQIGFGRLLIRRGDLFLLCSDGLTCGVSDEEIAQVIASEPSHKAAAERLVALANERGGPDNITVLLASLTGSALLEPREGETVTKTYQTIQEYTP